MVAAEEHRLSARALTAITGFKRLMIDDIINSELSVWARAWAGVFLCLGPIEMGTSQITSHVDFRCGGDRHPALSLAGIGYIAQKNDFLPK